MHSYHQHVKEGLLQLQRTVFFVCFFFALFCLSSFIIFLGNRFTDFYSLLCSLFSLIVHQWAWHHKVDYLGEGQLENLNIQKPYLIKYSMKSVGN